MKTRTTLLLLAAVLLILPACGILDSVLGGGGGGGVGGLIGGGSGGTVSDLWSDVPRLDGMTKANIDIPLPMRLMIQSMGGQGTSFDFIAFTTNKSATDVQNFYANDRMTKAGWNQPDMPGCSNDTGTSAGLGVFCYFGKQEGNQETLLMILGSQSDTSKPIDLYFVRVSQKGTPTPTR
jgi:hypothetical protein